MVVLRFFLLLQLSTKFPLYMFFVRSETLLLVGKNTEVSYKQIFIINSIVMTICILFAEFMPSIGGIIRFSGSLGGAALAFLLPCLVKLSIYKKEGKLTPLNIIIHGIIMMLGVANFVAQFFI